MMNLDHGDPDGNAEAPMRELDYEVLPDDEGARLDLFLNDRMVWRSRSSIQKLIEKGKIRLKTNGKDIVPITKPSRKVKPGEIFAVTIPRPTRELEALVEKEDLEIPILYEDEWILVVNKPAGIPVHPGGRLLDRTVITLLNESYRKWVDPEKAPLKLCHRLDIETSGVLLIGKDPVTLPGFGAQFENRQVEKEYLALVHGELEQEEGEIDLPIGLAKGSKIHMKRGVNFGRGQPARTGYRVDRRLPGYTLVRLRLYTGRHHQLRVHLAAIGHSIVGDKAYGPDEEIFIRYHEERMTDDDRARLILSRQALHAARLTLDHLALKKRMTFEAPLPLEIQEFMNGLNCGDEK
ncbi:MAG: RluA family pseudouridine synthase [Planctomycetota bacterium]|jgi:23S rRNA pseudouridine1911/1915/1917 synthase